MSKLGPGYVQVSSVYFFARQNVVNGGSNNNLLNSPRQRTLYVVFSAEKRRFLPENVTLAHSRQL